MTKQDKKSTAPDQTSAKEVSILSGEESKAAKPVKQSAKPAASEVKATLRYLRMSPKKVRLITNAVKGLAVNEALNRIQLMNKLAGREVAKLIRSAQANAEHNFKLNKENLYVKSATSNDGPVLKRYIPAAFGSAHPIKKRSCHVAVVLAVKEQAKPAIKPVKAGQPEIKKRLK